MKKRHLLHVLFETLFIVAAIFSLLASGLIQPVTNGGFRQFVLFTMRHGSVFPVSLVFTVLFGVAKQVWGNTPANHEKERRRNEANG